MVNGRIATAGLSYPGAVQWLAAVESPPHLACAFPAMCFSSARQFFYFGGAFDMSWLPWTFENIAPDDRRRLGNAGGPQTPREARPWWQLHGRDALARVPLRDQPVLQGVTPFYVEWLDHPDDGPYWEFADMEPRYERVRVPIFNFSGWHDEGYGPIGATHNFAGLRARPRRRRRARHGSSSGRGFTASRVPGKSATATSAPRRRSTTTRSCSTGVTCTRAASIAASGIPRRCVSS